MKRLAATIKKPAREISEGEEMAKENIKVWKEGGNVIVRSDALHITTYGKDYMQAMKNFKEALAVGARR